MSNESTVEAPAKVTLRSLQALRFIAAAMVLIGHLHDTLRRGRTEGLEPFWDPTGLPWHAGVDIFFVVSGFVMYFMTSRSFGRPGVPVQFLKRRVIRVVPLYWIFTLAAVIATLVLPGKVSNNVVTPSHVVASLLFIPWLSPSGGGAIPPLSVGWTLNFEFLFYAVFAAALAFPRRIGLAFITLVFLLLTTFKGYAPESLAVQVNIWGMKIVFEFLYGILIAYLFLSGVRLPIAVRVVCVVVALVLLSAGNQAGLNEFRDRWLYWGVPSAMIVAAFVLGPDLPDRWWSRLLVLGGDASYALYLSHLFTLRGVGLVWERLHGENSLLYFAVAFFASMAVAVMVHLMLEKPLLRVLRRSDGSARAPNAGAVRTAVGRTDG